MVHVVANGFSHALDVDGGRSLLSVLRGELGLSGAKPGCGEGECGACTVLVDGTPALSCQTPIGDVGGASITTIEGLGLEGKLHPLQEAFVRARASQCGYCTPGMVLRAAALLGSEVDPDGRRIAQAMNDNLCRCGCYLRIVTAIRLAAVEMSEDHGQLVRTSSSSTPDDGFARPAMRPARPWDMVPADEREWFEILGEGIVVVWPAPPSSAGAWSTSGGAWLHLAPSGIVSAFSGKVDVGQDNRTAFALLVAEELCVPYDHVQVVQGDTDLCPYDMGTFGSRSMPDAGEALRRAAAGARQVLVSLAADRLDVSREALSTSGDGTVRTGGGEFVLSYGELAAGTRRFEVLEGEPPLMPPSSWRLAGVHAPVSNRKDAVSGSRRFVSDLELPGMLHGAVLRSPAPGSLLRSADTTGAESIADVKVVHEDSFIAVIAPDPISARRGVVAIAAQWTDPAPGPDDLEAHLRAHRSEGTGWERPYEQVTGDVTSALAVATTRLEATYTAAYLSHAPLETRAALAEWESGRLTVWTGTQVPFGVRAQVAQAMRVDEADVRVIVPPTGGAFGGKHGAQVAIEAARLARSSGKPVKVHWSRSEEFALGGVRPMAVIDVRSGLDTSGAMTAWDFTNVNSGAAGIACPYDVPNMCLRYQPAQSPVAQVSYRALAATANHFARESHVDELAAAIGADPLEFRLGQLADERLKAVVEAAAERFGWPGAHLGAGVAAGLEKDGRVATFAEVDEQDGALRVTRVVTAYECGAVVNRDAVVNQIEGATVMGLGGALFEAVEVEEGRIANPAFSRYRVPRFADIPTIEVLLLDRRDLPSSGAGETPIVALAPAIANAIYAATHTRLRALPLLRGAHP